MLLHNRGAKFPNNPIYTFLAKKRKHNTAIAKAKKNRTKVPKTLAKKCYTLSISFVKPY
jgi:hypothetical protein